jgi:hypothetical protein
MVSSMGKLPASDLRFEDAMEAVGMGMVSLLLIPFSYYPSFCAHFCTSKTCMISVHGSVCILVVLS